MITPHNRGNLTAPIIDLFNRAISNGFAKQLKNKELARATSKRVLCSLEDKAIVQRFNAIIRGILNYYSFVNKKSSL